MKKNMQQLKSSAARAFRSALAVIFSVALSGSLLTAAEGKTGARQTAPSSEYQSLREIFEAARAAKADSPAASLLAQRNKLAAADGALNDRLGYSIAISGDTAIVGALGDRIGANENQGSAYIFVRSGATWVEQAKLTAADGAANDNFGYAVAISGDTAIVGAPLDDVGARADEGSVYIFTRNGTTWTQQQQLILTDGAGDNFGNSLAFAGNTLVVGAMYDDTPPTSGQGSVYIFTRSGAFWNQSQRLGASDAANGDYFGQSVALSGNTLVIGSPEDDSIGTVHHGSIYVFTTSGTTWSQQAKLNASDMSANDRFGYSVAISGDTLIAGAWNDSIGGNANQGSAYIFVGSGITWNQQTKLTASNGAANDNFGYAVAIVGETAIIGAYGDDVGGNVDQGSAYVFKRSGTSWTPQQQIIANDGAAGDQFGVNVTIAGTRTFFGANLSDAGSVSNAGAAYVFDSRPNNFTPFDFDGDGKTDLSVFRPSESKWYLQQSQAGNVNVNFGTASDRLTPTDYDGDGKTDLAVFTPANGSWSVRYSSNNQLFTVPFGQNGDIPAPGDYDGDGKADVAVFRPSNSTWYFNLTTGGTAAQQFGQAGDVPVAADYDGDGKADVAIYRPAVGEWWIQRSSNFSVVAAQFGNSADKAVPGDYTGDGRADIAIWRPSNGYWYILRSEDGSYYSVPFGTAGDLVTPGDYDGDGRFDTAVFRPSTATWYIQASTTGTTSQIFGLTGDRPVPNSFVP